VFVGRFISIREWMHWSDVVSRYGRNELRLDAVLALHRDLCDLWFPAPPRKHWWQQWFAARVSPVWLILEHLPLAVQVEAIASFLNSQAVSFGADPAETVPMFGSEGRVGTSGTKPSTPTPSQTTTTEEVAPLP